MAQNESRIALLGQENVKTVLLKLGIPGVVGMLVSVCYNLVDSFFVGRLGTDAIAAVAVVYPLSVLGIGVGTLFGVGAGSYISRLLGKKDFDKASECSSVTVITGLLTMITISVAIIIFFEPLISFMGASPEIIPLARAYGILFSVSLIFQVFNIMMNNLLSAEGNAAFGMHAMLAGGVINIALDPLFIFVAKMGIQGAALATVIATFCSSLFYIVYLARGKSLIRVLLSHFKRAKIVYGEIFKIGIPIFASNLLSGLSISLTNTCAAPFGLAAIAALGIVNRITSVESLLLSGFLKGYMPIAGFSWGAKNLKRLKECTLTLLLWSAAFYAIFTLVCFVLSSRVIMLFSKETGDVLHIGSFALRVNLFASLISVFPQVCSVCFLAIGKAVPGRYSEFCAAGLSVLAAAVYFYQAVGLKRFDFCPVCR
jgi:putative MATE family efflux protein